MTLSLFEKWQKNVVLKKSIICAGLDPAVYNLGRREQGLPEGADLLNWSKEYIKAVADYSAGIKINPSYFKSSKHIQEVIDFAKSLNLIVIYDRKLADITESNEAEIFFAAERGVDGITIAPFAGNLSATTKAAHKLNLGTIAVCIMSNSEYRKEKYMMVRIDAEEANELSLLRLSAPHYRQRLSLQMLPNDWLENMHMPYYAYLALKIRMSQTDGAVIGVSNLLTKEELLIVGTILSSTTLILVPGVGFQGGDSTVLDGIFDPKRLMINSGRALMYPLGLKSTPQKQRQAVKGLNDSIWKYFFKAYSEQKLISSE